MFYPWLKAASRVRPNSLKERQLDCGPWFRILVQNTKKLTFCVAKIVQGILFGHGRWPQDGFNGILCGATATNFQKGVYTKVQLSNEVQRENISQLWINSPNILCLTKTNISEFSVLVQKTKLEKCFRVLSAPLGVMASPVSFTLYCLYWKKKWHWLSATTKTTWTLLKLSSASCKTVILFHPNSCTSETTASTKFRIAANQPNNCPNFSDEPKWIPVNPVWIQQWAMEYSNLWSFFMWTGTVSGKDFGNSVE